MTLDILWIRINSLVQHLSCRDYNYSNNNSHFLQFNIMDFVISFIYAFPGNIITTN